jgi:hypothetical protein
VVTYQFGVLNVQLKLVAEVAYSRGYRPSGSIAQWANGVALYLLGYINQ